MAVVVYLWKFAFLPHKMLCITNHWAKTMRMYTTCQMLRLVQFSSEEAEVLSHIFDSLSAKLFSEPQALVPGAWNKLGKCVIEYMSWVSEWLSDWVHYFSPWANSAMAAAKETKFGRKVA